LTLDRAYSQNSSEQYDVTNGIYNPRSPYDTGIFSISTVLIKTSFSTSDENSSTAFSDFRSNRLTVANRLASQRGIDINNPANRDAEGYPIGYGKKTIRPFTPAFLAAYSGGADDVSLDFRNFPFQTGL
jgi:cell surface protein SprA